MQALLERDVDHVEMIEDMMLTLQGFFVLRSYYADIVDELKNLEFVNAPPEVQIHRLVAFVESQSRTMEKKLMEMQQREDTYDPLTGHASSISSQFDNSKTSVGETFDVICENIELGLRLILHSHTLPTTPKFQPDYGPFNDPDIAKFIALAGIWRMVTEAWANMRFRGWRWICYGEGRRGCVPMDNAAYIREHAGTVRYQLFMVERILHSAVEEADPAAYFTRQKEVAASITIPQAGEVWDGSVDVESLRELRDLSPLNTAIEKYVDQRHYLPLVDRVKIGSIGWREWCAGKATLYCLADCISQAATNQLSEDDFTCMGQVVVVHKETLSRILTDCGSLTPEQAPELVDALRFDPTRKSLEIWDQPLIPCGNGILFLVPAFIKTGSPARALENFVTEWGGASFDLRGTPFEESVVTEIHNRSTARAERGITIQRSDDKDLEFDIVAWWQGYLLLLEAKCEKAVFSAADYHRAKAQIEKSIDQLIIRREALSDVWAELREKAPSLGLPEEFIDDDRVLCISITNIMDFTGHSRDGVVVTDDSCFLRFFGERVIRKYTLGGDVEEELAPIRASETPHPSELIPYLLNPVQMQMLTDKMKLKSHVIPAITDRSSGFFSVHVEFDLDGDGGLDEWKPCFVSDKAYAIATLLCQTRQYLNLDELQDDAELMNAADELTQQGIIGGDNDNPRLLRIILQDPICVRLPDERYAIGENISGQMSWWINKHFPDTGRTISPQFARYLAGESE